MSRRHRYCAVLDACVLYPAPLRDLLLSLAAAGVYGARWTSRIQDEWIRNILINRPDLDPSRLARTATLMRDAIDDCLIDNFEHLIDSLTLPDPDDRHVLAAAIVGRTDAIITFNLKDFPDTSTSVHGIEIVHPDDFIVAQYLRDPAKILSIISGLRARLIKPSVPADRLLSTYEQQGLPKLSNFLRTRIDLI